MWRKNRQKNKDSNCMGVDPNRNWPVDWVSSSKDPCAETFRGPSEASEPEVQGLMAMIKDIQQKQGLKLFIDWHSYGQVMTVRTYSDLIRVRKPQIDVLFDSIRLHVQ